MNCRWCDIVLFGGLFGFVIIGLVGFVVVIGWEEMIE